MHFNWANPYPTVRTPVFARNIVATSQPLAAQAGLRVMQGGGNAVDAAIAAAAVITMTEPCSNGLGADNFAIVWDPATRQLLGLNASGTAPAAWTLDYFRRKYGEDLAKNRPVRGWDTVTVPGAVAGWGLLHGRLGRLPFADVLAPAIEYAERGFAVSAIVQEKWQRAVPLLKDGPGFAAHFMPRGRAPEIGEHFTLAGAARTFRLLAQHGAAAFYQGEIADCDRAARAGHRWGVDRLRLRSLLGVRAAARLGRHDQHLTSMATNCTRSPRTGRASPRFRAWGSCATPRSPSAPSTAPTGSTR